MFIKPFILNSEYKTLLKKLPGPIFILGAGGFVGSNVLTSFLLYRSDVYGISRNTKLNKRLKLINGKNLLDCDISNISKFRKIVKQYKPQVIINLAVYGAYSWEKNYKKIYKTNTLSILSLIEIFKKNKIHSFINIGSSSEYGENSSGTDENSNLFPNSHYALSKVFSHYLTQYYGKIEKFPICYLRLYSVYGPFEDEKRFISSLINHGRLTNDYPNLVSPDITRDFIYTSDVTTAIIACASQINKNFGETFNVGTGHPISIKKAAIISQNIFKIKNSPKFSTMQKRDWDHGKKWYADISKIKKILKWKPTVTFKDGFKLTAEWYKNNND